MTARQLDGFVARLTALGGGSGDSRKIYQEWAPAYDATMHGQYGYVAPKIAADAFAAQRPDPDCRILDLGCGTGLVGAELAARGFRRIDGLDISRAMLAEARKKAVYGDLICGDLRQPPNPGRRYDAAIAVGCFGGGHIGPEHLPGVIGLVAAGGLLVLYVNEIPYLADDYPARFRTLEADRAWRVLLTARSNYMQALERPGWVVVARRTDADSPAPAGAAQP